MLFLFLLASLVASLPTAAAPASYGSYGNFSLSCTAVDLFHNFFLGATCCHPSSDGVDAQSDNELDLTMCIGLDQVSGHMQWEVYGKFSNYCTNCTIQASSNPNNNKPAARSHLLTCSCSPLVGGGRGPVRSAINLDEGITNDMGTLTCAGGMASLGRAG